MKGVYKFVACVFTRPTEEMPWNPACENWFGSVEAEDGFVAASDIRKLVMAESKVRVPHEAFATYWYCWKSAAVAESPSGIRFDVFGIIPMTVVDEVEYQTSSQPAIMVDGSKLPKSLLPLDTEILDPK